MQMKILTGNIVTSHKHLYDHLSYLVSGEVIVRVEGQAPMHRIAPCAIEIKAGIVHEIAALKDTVWLCIHGTEETNPDNIDKVLIQPSVGLTE